MCKFRLTVQDMLVVADPCYIDLDDARRGDVHYVVDGLGLVLISAAGEWEAEVDLEDEYGSKRVAALRARRVGTSVIPSGYWDHEADAGVDSGQMFMGDASAFGHDYEELLDVYRPRKPDGTVDRSDADMSAWATKDFFAYRDGVVSSTGYGDGQYRVYVARDSDGVPYGVEVRFVEEEEDEED